MVKRNKYEESLDGEGGCYLLNPLSPNSDENEISLYICNTCSNIQVARIKKVITKNKMS